MAPPRKILEKSPSAPWKKSFWRPCSQVYVTHAKVLSKASFVAAAATGGCSRKFESLFVRALHSHVHPYVASTSLCCFYMIASIHEDCDNEPCFACGKVSASGTSCKYHCTHRRSQGGTWPPRIFSYLVILRFEKRRPVMALGPLHTENRLSPRVIPRRKARRQRK